MEEQGFLPSLKRWDSTLSIFMNFKIYLYLSLIILCFFCKINAFQFIPNDEKLKSICESYDIDFSKYNSNFNKSYFAKQDYNDFAIITIPKSGTYILNKLLSLITGRVKNETIWNNYEPQFMLHIQKHPEEFISGHDVNFVFNLNNIKFITTIRDFRDILISWIYYIHWTKTKNWEIPKEKVQNILTQILVAWKNENISNEFLKEILPVIARTTYWRKKIIEKNKNQNVFFVKFEDIVGEKGGGSISLQQQTIQQLSTFLNISLSEKQSEFLCKVLHGNSFTFRKGTIGSWREIFTQEHKKIFKRNFNHLLIDFGYEKDDKW
ncbi:MAG: hypothetical protein K1060chlam1_00630 [Candidatus Anoxychlamydiales bacterium]|nr:hypothetical protein [Candidatus Anoxychlamydiales bacterium]